MDSRPKSMGGKAGRMLSSVSRAASAVLGRFTGGATTSSREGGGPAGSGEGASQETTADGAFLMDGILGSLAGLAGQTFAGSAETQAAQARGAFGEMSGRGELGKGEPAGSSGVIIGGKSGPGLGASARTVSEDAASGESGLVSHQISLAAMAAPSAAEAGSGEPSQSYAREIGPGPGAAPAPKAQGYRPDPADSVMDTMQLFIMAAAGILAVLALLAMNPTRHQFKIKWVRRALVGLCAVIIMLAAIMMDWGFGNVGMSYIGTAAVLALYSLGGLPNAVGPIIMMVAAALPAVAMKEYMKSVKKPDWEAQKYYWV